MHQESGFEYRVEELGRVGDVREFLHRCFKQGWRLWSIEGRVLRLRRKKGAGRAA
jgi:hypothetical protein